MGELHGIRALDRALRPVSTGRARPHHRPSCAPPPARSGVARPVDRVESAHPTVPAGSYRAQSGPDHEQLRRHRRVESTHIASWIAESDDPT